MSIIAGVGIALINPITVGIVVALAGIIYSGIKFTGEE
jgi:hypothetical protein